MKEYKEYLLNTISNDYTNDLRAQIVRMLLEKQIATRKKDEDNKIYVKGLEPLEKIECCIRNNDDTVKYIELFEMLKGYKYSLLYKLKSYDSSKINDYAVNVEGSLKNFEYKHGTLYYDTDDVLIIKFHKEIDIIDDINGGKSYIRYPLVVIIHKKLDIIEYRFDRIVHKREDDFYKITQGPIRSWLVTNLKLVSNEYSLGSILTELIDSTNYSADIKQEICSYGLPGEQGLVVKYGEKDTSPVFGELEDLIKANREDFTDKSIELLEDFIFERKVLSSKHFREIKWLKAPYKGENRNNENRVYVKNRINFNYKNRNEDLIIFYNSKYNDMERMSYVIKYFEKVRRSLEK